MAQEITITYGGLTFGGSTARILDGYHYSDKGADEAEVEFSFVTTAASDSAFATEIDTIEDALRVPRGALVVTANSQTLLSLSHSANTGFESRPVVVKEGTPGADSIRSRRYTVRIAFQLPADGTSGLRMGATIAVEIEPNTRRRMTLTGTFTALPDTGSGVQSATAVYDANLAGLVTAGLSIAGMTAAASEKVSERFEPGSANKTVDFEVVYRQLLTEDIGASGGSLDVDNIVEQKIRISRMRHAPGDTVLMEVLGEVSGGLGGQSAGPQGGGQAGGPGATVFATQGANPGSASSSVDRMRHITVEYEAWVKPAAGSALDLWQDSVRDYLLDLARAFNDGRPVAIIRDEPRVGTTDRQLLGTLEVLGEGEARIAEQTISTSIMDESFGNVLIPVWNGNQYAYYKHPGPAVKVYKVMVEKFVIGTASPEDLAAPLGGGVGNLVAVPMSNAPERQQVRFGTPDAFIDGERVRLEGRAQLVQLVTASGGGPAAGGGQPINPSTPTVPTAQTPS
jgi:hypothetical protein